MASNTIRPFAAPWRYHREQQHCIVLTKRLFYRKRLRDYAKPERNRQSPVREPSAAPMLQMK